VTQPDETTQDANQPPSGGPGAGTALAVGAVVLAAGLPDPWWPSRLRRYAALVRAERRFYQAYTAFLGGWMDKLRGRVVSHQVVDPWAVESMRGAFRLGVDPIVDTVIREIVDDGFSYVMLHTPVPTSYVDSYLQGVSNRLSNVPDAVFALVRKEVQDATNEGWSMDQLAARVHTVLSDNDVSTWRNRALVIARTEAIGAYNAGTLAGFHGYAASAGGQWEKGWLCTHDARTRPTHLAADVGSTGGAQRVPLAAPFAVGAALLDHPGAHGPVALPEETVQCRCSLVLLRPGEKIDLSNRHGKGQP
jgi:hypothetical protein